MSEKMFGCRCGAVNASAAAYMQMNRTQQLDFRIRIKSCQTCAYDRVKIQDKAQAKKKRAE